MGVQLRSGSDSKMGGMAGSAEWPNGTLPVAWCWSRLGQLWRTIPDSRDSACLGLLLVSGGCRWRPERRGAACVDRPGQGRFRAKANLFELTV
jgi:hypothetical protein